MAAKPDGLFVHGDLIREDGSLGKDPGFVNGRGGQDLLELFLQPGPIVGHRLGAALFDFLHQPQNGLAPAPKVLLQGLPFRAAHGIKVLQGLLGYHQQILLQLLLIHLGLIQAEYIGQPRKRCGRNIVWQAVAFAHLLHGGQISLYHGGVEGNGDIRGSLRAQGDEHVHLAPGDPGLYRLLHRILPEGHRPGELHGTIQIPVVHAADLYGEFSAVDGLHSPAVAGHAFHHGHYPLLNREKSRRNRYFLSIFAETLSVFKVPTCSKPSP